MKHLLSCSCGGLQGEIINREVGVRAVCYCRDCQTFATFLGQADDILDEAGGTEVIGLRPSNLRFTKGLKNLACVSLSDKGLLRWYANCCNTPIGNTPRNFKLAHIGLIHNCVDGAPANLDSAFGPVRLRVNTGAAKKPTKAYGAGVIVSLQHVASLIAERFTGRYKMTPFFDEFGTPVVVPKVRTNLEHKKLVKP